MQSFAQSITKYNERKGRMIYKDFKELSLSRLGMGNMRLPTKLGRINQKKAQEMSLTKDKKRWEEAVKAQNGPDTCIGCGQCTSHCPQNIDVPGYMKKLAAGKY